MHHPAERVEIYQMTCRIMCPNLSHARKDNTFLRFSEMIPVHVKG